MLKKLGKKQAMSNGSLQAFACSCQGCSVSCSCKKKSLKTSTQYDLSSDARNLTSANDFAFSKR